MKDFIKEWTLNTFILVMSIVCGMFMIALICAPGTMAFHMHSIWWLLLYIPMVSFIITKTGSGV